MANPTPYTPAYSFSGYQASSPTIPLPADRIDAEFAAIDTALDSTQTALNEVRRSDGKLQNHIVGVDSLGTDVLALFSGDPSPRGVWAAGTAYEIGDLVTSGSASYLCAIAHTSSAAFVTDLGFGYWTLLAGLAAAAGSIGTVELADGGVTLAKLAADSVDDSKIIDGSVGANELAANSVTTTKITNLNVTTAKIADAAVTTAKIADGSITARKESDDPWSSVASAATVDLGAVTSRNVLVTGTTTITSFGNTGTEGRTVRVRFAAALTLTYNATTLILPSVSSITTAAGDTALFVKESGASAWRCVEYLRANGQAVVASNQVIVDRAFASYTTAANLSATIPHDDTIPQNTEGTQILSASITPNTTTNRLRARVRINGTTSAGGYAAAALFTSGADALDAAFIFTPGDSGGSLVLEHEWVPGVTTSVTVTVRAGPTSLAGTNLILNGSAGPTRRFGGVMQCTLVLEEIAA